MALVRYNFGYNKSNFSTLDKVNLDLLKRELRIRGITCEVPNCRNTAVTVLNSGVTALLCEEHDNFSKKGIKATRTIEEAVKLRWQNITATVAEWAYADAKEHVTITYTSRSTIVDTARSVMNQGSQDLLFGLFM